LLLTVRRVPGEEEGERKKREAERREKKHKKEREKNAQMAAIELRDIQHSEGKEVYTEEL